MKLDILHILNGIGYQKALLFDHSLTFQFWGPMERGNRYFKDKHEAKDIIRRLLQLSDLLQDMPPRMASLLNDQAKTPEDWERGRDPLFDVAGAVDDLSVLAQMEANQIWPTIGVSRRVAGEDIAKHMAHIFVLGLGRFPGSGADSDGHPSGDFPKAVQGVFEAMKMPDNFRRPCKVAVAWLKANNNEQFNRLMQRRQMKGKRLSLFPTERN